MMVGVANVLFAAVVGAIVGVVWGLALDVDVWTDLIVALAVGAVVFVFLNLVASAVSRAVRQGGDNLEVGEALFVSGSIVVLLAVVSIGLGLVLWLIRVLIT